MKISFGLVILIFGLGAVASTSLPSFHWLNVARFRASSGGLMRMILADNSSATIHLTPYNPLPDVELSRQASCLYHGTISNDKDAKVAVTGCPSDEKVEITIVSAKDQLNVGGNQFILYTSSGKVEAIPSPWMSGSWTDAMEVDEESIVKNRWDDYGDEWFDDATEKEAEGAAKYCKNNAGSVECTIPKSMKMTVKLGYDDSLAAQEKDSVSWISKVMTHTQVFYKHPSLGSDITIEVIGAPKKYTGKWTAEKSLPGVRKYAAKDMTTDLYAFFCKDPAYYGVVGLAYVGTMCKYNTWGYQVSMNEWRKTAAETAKVVAHEIGHNIGMSHDFDTKHKGKGCTGVMNYGTTPDSWSKCSVADFKAHYEAVFKMNTKHCLDIL